MKRKVILILIIGLLLIISLAEVIHRINYNYIAVIEKNWNLNISNDNNFKEIYSKETTPSFNGDGYRYHVFSYKNIEDLNIKEWSNNDKKTIFYDSIIDYSNATLDYIKVIKKNRPNYDNLSYWYSFQDDNSEIVIIKDSKKIYVIESFF